MDKLAAWHAHAQPAEKMEHYFENFFEEDDDEESLRAQIMERKCSGYRISSAQLATSDIWIPSLKQCTRSFSSYWPSCHEETSMFVNTLLAWKKVNIRREPIADHMQCLQLLQSFIQTNVIPIPPSTLFHDILLFQEEALSEYSSEEQKTVEIEQLHRIRSDYISTLLKCNATFALSLSPGFGLSVDVVRAQYIVHLFAKGEDVQAEQSLFALEDCSALGKPLAKVCRFRLRTILNTMKRNPQYAPLMTTIAADTCAWIQSDAPPLQVDAALQVNASVSLKATDALLQRALHYLPESKDRVYTTRMSNVSKALIQTVQWAEKHGLQ